MTSTSRTLCDKIWDNHVVDSQGQFDLLWVDRHFVHEGSFHAFDKLEMAGHYVAHPELTFGIADHYVPSLPKGLEKDQEAAGMIRLLEENTLKHQLSYFGINNRNQGIVHVAAPEQGLTLPGLIIVCGDSHTSTHGAFGAFAMGIGASEVAHVLATQTLWQRRPKKMLITIDGALQPGVTAKDLALHLIHTLGTSGATGYAVEYNGDAVARMSMDERMTLCNMTIEAGARVGMVAPDDVTLAYLLNTERTPRGKQWRLAVDHWQQLHTDEGAYFDHKIVLDAHEVAPRVSWGTSPEQSVAIDQPLSLERNDVNNVALKYMGLESGQRMTGLPVDQVFIGSCTNSRMSDLRAAATVLKGGKVKVPTLVVAGSNRIKAQAEAEGISDVFLAAGARWGESGCSMCVSMNGDSVSPEKRCASTSNRNFPGRQGPGARTHLMSPAMAAAAALYGHIVDVRDLSLEVDK